MKTSVEIRYPGMISLTCGI